MSRSQLGDPITPTKEALAVSATPPAVLAWMAAVKKRGGVVTRHKDGRLAARFGAKAPFVYETAPLAALAADAARNAGDQTRIAAVKVLDTVQGGARAILESPITAVSKLTGLSPRLVKGLAAIGLVALVVGKFRGRRRD